MNHLKMFLMPLLVSLFLFVPRDAFAAVTWNWTDGEQLRMPTVSNVFKCNGTSCPKSNNWQPYDLTNSYIWTQSQSGEVDYYKEYQVFGTSSDISFDSNDSGLLVTFMPSTYLKSNFYYSLSFYMCTSDNTNLNLLYSYSGRNDNDFVNLSYRNTGQGTNWLNVSNRPFFEHDNSPYTTCRAYSHLFKSTLDKAEYVGLLFNTGSNAKTISHIALFGYNLTSLGADISSLPTTSTFNNLQSSINDVQSNVNGVKNEITSINDTLTDSSSPDLGGLGNTSTWLPQGPVDSIIMLPLNFINTLVSKIGSTCSPVNLPIPFVENKYLTLPCMSTIFGQIEGFSTLFNLVGVIGSVYLLYNYLLKFYKWIDDTLSFRENNWQDWGGD